MDLQENPQTGFLEAQRLGNVGFSSEKKVKFLQLCQEYVDKYKNFPPTHEIAKATGITSRCFYLHLKEDPKFKQAWKEIQLGLQAHFTQKIGEKANTKQGTLANLAALRFLESGSWNPNQGLNPVSHDSPTKRIMEHFNEYIDAEIVPESSTNPTNNKQITGGNNGNYGA
jgi:hypothetical protein